MVGYDPFTFSRVSTLPTSEQQALVAGAQALVMTHSHFGSAKPQRVTAAGRDRCRRHWDQDGSLRQPWSDQSSRGSPTGIHPEATFFKWVLLSFIGEILYMCSLQEFIVTQDYCPTLWQCPMWTKLAYKNCMGDFRLALKWPETPSCDTKAVDEATSWERATQPFQQNMLSVTALRWLPGNPRAYGTCLALKSSI